MLTASILGIAIFICGAALAAEAPSADRSTPGTAQLPIHADEKNDASLVKAALEAGASPDCPQTNTAGTLLHILSGATEPLTAQQRACASLLLSQGANPNAQDSNKQTLLIHAARIGDLDTIRLLVEAGAYVKARDRFHKTALIHAVEAHRRDIVLYLASNGDLQSLTFADQKARQPKR